MGPPLWSSAFLPAVFQGTFLKSEEADPYKLIRHVKPQADAAAQRRQLDLLARLNREHLATRGKDSQLEGSIEQRARRSAVIALLAVLEIPLVHFSVVAWRSLHQRATVLDPNGDIKMDGLMLFTLFSGVIGFTLVFVWLVVHRQRTMLMGDLADQQGLDTAILARQNEGVSD